MAERVPTPVTMTTGRLAALVGGELSGSPDLVITGIEAIELAGPGMVTFIRESSYAGKWAESRATAALVSRGVVMPAFDGSARAVIMVTSADAAVVAVLGALAPAGTAAAGGVHAAAFVDPSAKVDTTATVGPMCVVGAGAEVGPGAVLTASVTIGAGAKIGASSVLHPGVVVGDRCIVGESSILQPGVKIGADGFGYIPGKDGIVKIPHIGTVVIGKHVEIGANTCIDRAKFGATTVGDGTKIDNLVQIGHNCRIGRLCLICGQCGLSGSVTVGDGVILAGGVGVADNLTIGAGARIGASSGVMNDIPAGESWLGSPAMPIRDAAQNYAMFRDLAKHIRELRRQLKAEVPGS